MVNACQLPPAGVAFGKTKNEPLKTGPAAAETNQDNAREPEEVTGVVVGPQPQESTAARGNGAASHEF